MNINVGAEEAQHSRHEADSSPQALIPLEGLKNALCCTHPFGGACDK